MYKGSWQSRNQRVAYSGFFSHSPLEDNLAKTLTLDFHRLEL